MTFDPALRCFGHHAVRCERPECQAELRWRREAVETVTASTMPAKPYQWVFRPKDTPH